jgi:exosortase
LDERVLSLDANHVNMSTRVRMLFFLVLCALSILLFWSSLADVFRLALSNDGYTHILLILPLSIALVYFDSKHRDLRCLFSGQGSVVIGVPLALSFAIVFSARWFLANSPYRLSLGIFSLVIWWIGSIVLCFGVKILESFVFPVCFLFLLVPLPQPALERVVEFLQHQSAFATEMMFRSAGVSVVRDGLILSIPGLNIEVAPECSSIRTSELLVITALILSQLFLRSWWNKLLLVLAAVPLSIAKNAFRIFTIAEMGTRVDPSFLNGSLHRQGGLLFYGLGVILVVGLLIALRHTELRAQHSPKRVSSGHAVGAS